MAAAFIAVTFCGLVADARAAGQSLGGAVTAPHRDGHLLVRFRDGTASRSRSAAHDRTGATVLASFASVAGLDHVRLPAGMDVVDALRRYSADPAVAYAEPDYTIRIDSIPDDPAFGQLWSLHNVGDSGGLADADIDATDAWDVTTGDASVVVAVLDTGIDYSHADLADNVFTNTADCDYDEVDDDRNGFADDCHGIDVVQGDGDPYDLTGHGTHVAGIIGASADNAIGVAGVAPNVRVLSCRFLDSFGSGSVSGAVRCYDYVRSWSARGVKIVATNNSWGVGVASRALSDAIAAQTESGILTVVAAGNQGSNSATYPAALEDAGVLSIAATTRTDDLAGFSNRGRATVHLGAPGEGIYSTYWRNRYRTRSGTSMAAPHVAGSLALLAAHDPTASMLTLRNLVLSSGDPLDALSQTTTSRRLNVHRALTCSDDELLARWRPGESHITVAPGDPVRLAVFHIRCGSPAGEIDVVVEPGGAVIPLKDDGNSGDVAAGDGVYTAQWVPPSADTFMVQFPGGDTVTVEVRSGIYSNPLASLLDGFGESLDTQGNLLLVGAPRDDAAADDAGAAYLYDAASGLLRHRFTAPGAGPDESFGEHVDLAGDLVLIGAPLSDATFANEGAAYLFDVTSGALIHAFANPSPKASDYFGSSIAILEDAVFIGADQDDSEAENAGLGYVFDLDTGQLAGIVHDPFPVADERFAAAAVAIGPHAAITTVADNHMLGIVRNYDLDAESPSFGAALHSYVVTPAFEAGVLPPGLGSSLAAGNGLLLAGDPSAYQRIGTSDDSYIGTGAALLYDAVSGAFAGALRDPAPARGNAFGTSVALHDRWAVIGAPRSRLVADGGGAAYLFDVETGDLRRFLIPPLTSDLDAAGEAVAIGASGVFVGVPRGDVTQVDGGAVHRFDPLPAVRSALECYDISGQKAPPDLHTVEDPFGRREIAASSSRKLCVGTARDGYANADETRHALCYGAKPVAETPRSQTTIRYVDTHGIASIVLRRIVSVCMPAGADGAPASPLLDAYTCYKAVPAPGAARFVPDLYRLTDVHDARTFEASKLVSFCTASAIDGIAPSAPEDHLACYRIKPLPGQAHLARFGVETSDAFLDQTVVAISAGTMCLPATIIGGALP